MNGIDKFLKNNKFFKKEIARLEGSIEYLQKALDKTYVFKSENIRVHLESSGRIVISTIRYGVSHPIPKKEIDELIQFLVSLYKEYGNEV